VLHAPVALDQVRDLDGRTQQTVPAAELAATVDRIVRGET